MRGFLPYIIICIMASFVLHKKKIVKKYIGRSRLYTALLLMMMANLSFPKPIQYGLRIIGIGYSTVVILGIIVRRNKLRISAGSNVSLNRTYALYIIFALYALISIAWSYGKLETFVKVIEIMIDITLLYLALMLHGDRSVTAFSTLFIIFSSIMIVSCLLGAVIDPADFIRSSRGVWGFQLRSFLYGVDWIAGLATMLIIFLLNIPRFKMKWILFLSAGLVVVLAQARTSIAICGAAIVIHMISRGTKPIYIVAFLIGVTAFVLNFDLFIAYFNRGSYQTNIANLNGRKVIWAIAEQMSKDSPLLGYGYGAGGILAASQVRGLDNTHNGYYEILMGLGYIGVCLVGLQVISALWNIARRTVRYHFNELTFELMFVVYLILRSYTGTGVGGWSSSEYICWLFLLLNVSRRKSKAGLKQQFIKGSIA